jgi:hypothetical protein
MPLGFRGETCALNPAKEVQDRGELAGSWCADHAPERSDFDYSWMAG